MSKDSQPHSRLDGLPRTDEVLALCLAAGAARAASRSVLLTCVREALRDARCRVHDGATCPTADAVAGEVTAKLQRMSTLRCGPVINATGVVLHTNLGRAPLSRRAAEALERIAGAYGAVEMDLATGRRGRRASYVEWALARLVGAEAALVVNNNAAAVLLALSALVAPGAAIVSRGELVEIGGGFRIPEILRRSGAQLVEVGTTNRTYPSDYEQALAEATDVRAILRVEQANFRQRGFVHKPGLGELASIAKKHEVLLIEDLGSGALFDVGESTVPASVRAGVDLVCFSTDKLLGGPQGGAMVGHSDLVERARRDPLARAVRLGLLPIVALEATLDAYLNDRLSEIPVLRMLQCPFAELWERAERLATRLEHVGLRSTPTRLEAASGGGSLADEPIPSAGVALEVASIDRFLSALRSHDPPVIARTDDGRVVLDVLTILPHQEDIVIEAVASAARCFD